MAKNNRFIGLGVLVVIVILGVFWYLKPTTGAKTSARRRLADKAYIPPSTATAAPQGEKACPKPSTLVLKNHLWYAPGGWKSFTTSFAEHIAGFSGAQWIGVNVGKIICIYQSDKRSAFPISIERDNLIRSPTGKYWTRNLGGHKNCKSTNVFDCSFKPAGDNMTNKPLDTESLYEGIHKPS